MPLSPKSPGRAARRQSVGDHKRELILGAARRVFESEGLDGASLRAIAAEAGYTPAALYFHFDSKEAIYAEMLDISLGRLADAVLAAADAEAEPAGRLRAAALAFFAFYAENPRDLDLGFYLLRGGLKPKGLGRARDERLNAALAVALAPIGAGAEALGATPEAARLLVVDVFAHAVGLLLLTHTGRIRMFEASAPDLMRRYLDERVRGLLAGRAGLPDGRG
jgi:AcrR family transcriptional regulator